MKQLFSILFHDVYADDSTLSGFAGPGAERYKIPLTDFDAHLYGLRRIFSDPPALVTQPIPAVTGRFPFAITVDDGGVSYYTEVAARLEAVNWRAHCFITTDRIGQRGFLARHHIRELHARGHIVGSHSVSHPARFAACKWEQMVSEWERSRKTLQDILGSDVTCASIPGGGFSRRVAQAASSAGLSVLFTSEPELRVRNLDGCDIYGRFTVRKGCRVDFVTRLVQGNAAARYREWTIWNGKKLLKGMLGAAYPQFAQWMLRPGR